VNVDENEQKLLRSAALKNAESILIARQRAERELLATKEELERTTEELRQGAERLQLALAAGTLGDWSWNARTDLFSVGARAADILGLSATSPVTRAQIQEHMSRHDREQANVAFQEALATR